MNLKPTPGELVVQSASMSAQGETGDQGNDMADTPAVVADTVAVAATSQPAGISVQGGTGRRDINTVDASAPSDGTGVVVAEPQPTSMPGQDGTGGQDNAMLDASVAVADQLSLIHI